MYYNCICVEARHAAWLCSEYIADPKLNTGVGEVLTFALPLEVLQF